MAILQKEKEENEKARKLKRAQYEKDMRQRNKDMMEELRKKALAGDAAGAAELAAKEKHAAEQRAKNMKKCVDWRKRHKQKIEDLKQELDSRCKWKSWDHIMEEAEAEMDMEELLAEEQGEAMEIDALFHYLFEAEGAAPEPTPDSVPAEVQPEESN